MIKRLRDAWIIFWKMLTGKPLTVLDFQNVLNTFPEAPMAKIVHKTRKYDAIQFIVKLYRPQNAKTRKGVAW